MNDRPVLHFIPQLFFLYYCFVNNLFSHLLLQEIFKCFTEMVDAHRWTDLTTISSFPLITTTAVFSRLWIWPKWVSENRKIITTPPPPPWLLNARGGGVFFLCSFVPFFQCSINWRFSIVVEIRLASDESGATTMYEAASIRTNQEQTGMFVQGRKNGKNDPI